MGSIKSMVDQYSPYEQTYWMARDRIAFNNSIDVEIRLIAKRAHDGRTYNLPSTSEVVAIIEGDIENIVEKRDILLETRSGTLTSINEFLPCYLPL